MLRKTEVGEEILTVELHRGKVFLFTFAALSRDRFRQRGALGHLSFGGPTQV